MKQRPAGEKDREFRIEELAELGRTTVRNIRVYQEKGLLPPPVRRGRTAWYGEAHRKRLQRITGLLDRGYTFATISELFTAERSGLTVTELIEAESARALRRSKRRSRDQLPAFEEHMGVRFSESLRSAARATGVAVVAEDGQIEHLDNAVHEMIHYLAGLGMSSAGFERFGVAAIEALEELQVAFMPIVELIIDNAAEAPPFTTTRAEFDDAAALAGTVVRRLYLQLVRTAFEARLEQSRTRPEKDNG